MTLITKDEDREGDRDPCRPPGTNGQVHQVGCCLWTRRQGVGGEEGAGGRLCGDQLPRDCSWKMSRGHGDRRGSSSDTQTSAPQ